MGFCSHLCLGCFEVTVLLFYWFLYGIHSHQTFSEVSVGFIKDLEGSDKSLCAPSAFSLTAPASLPAWLPPSLGKQTFLSLSSSEHSLSPWGLVSYSKYSSRCFFFFNPPKVWSVKLFFPAHYMTKDSFSIRSKNFAHSRAQVTWTWKGSISWTFPQCFLLWASEERKADRLAGGR